MKRRTFLAGAVALLGARSAMSAQLPKEPLFWDMNRTPIYAGSFVTLPVVGRGLMRLEVIRTIEVPGRAGQQYSFGYYPPRPDELAIEYRDADGHSLGNRIGADRIFPAVLT